MRDKGHVELVLSGGLGNQLFLLAAGLSICRKDQTLVINCSLGQPRLSKNLAPDLLSFFIPKDIELKYSETSRLKKHLHLFLLKLASKQFSNSSLNRSYVLAKNTFGLLSKRFIFKKYFLSDGVGSDPRLIETVGSQRIIGNFHTFSYCSDPKSESVMHSLKLIEIKSWLRELQAIANGVRPIVVQIRRGDYIGISELGILDENFFLPLIKKLAAQFPQSEIWIFSDDYCDIFKYVPIDLYDRIRLIDADVSDSASNLEAMREGLAYIISNSTFGWWGAFLSKSLDPIVYCPSNWFNTLPNPNDLLPQKWIKVANK